MRKAWIRARAFLRKEIVEIVRQPQLVLALIGGPFLILLLFGVGLGDLAPPVRTVFLVPEDSAFNELAADFRVPFGSRLRPQGVLSDREEALRRLDQGQVDLVVEIPEDAEERFANDDQALVTLYHDYIDPLENNALILTVGRAVGALNDQVLLNLVAEGQEDAAEAQARVAAARQATAALQEAVARGDEAAARARLEEVAEAVEAANEALDVAGIAPVRVQGLVGEGEAAAGVPALLDELRAQVGALAGLDLSADDPLADVTALERDLERLDDALTRFESLSPETIVSPFVGRAERIGEAVISLRDFYAPAVVVLLVQHMVVTIVTLSVVRDEQLGTVELFRVAPLSTGELLLGKYLAAVVVGAALSAAVIALLVTGLGVPMAGSWAWLVVVVFGIVVASAGLGFLLALLATSDSQAVQYAMLLLLASIFLSGFVLTLEYFRTPIQILARLLPATLGIEMLRGVMLQGARPALVPLLGLTALGVGLVVLNGWLLRRSSRAR